MGFYLKRSETEYSDYMPKAKEMPPDRPDGVWVEGSPDGMQPWVRPEPAVILTAEFLRLRENHTGKAYFNVTAKTQLWMLKAAVNDAMKEGEYADALEMIQSAVVPPQMQADRDAIYQKAVELLQNA